MTLALFVHNKSSYKWLLVSQNKEPSIKYERERTIQRDLRPFKPHRMAFDSLSISGKLVYLVVPFWHLSREVTADRVPMMKIYSSQQRDHGE